MTIHTSVGVVPWPRDYAVSYRERGFWRDRALGEYVLDVADRDPLKTALVSGDIRLSYRDLVDRMDAAAERMLQLGLKADDRVLVQLPNDWQFLVFTLACFRSGVIPVMALPAHRSHELTHLASHSEAVALVVPDEVKGFDHRALAFDIAAASSSVKWVLSTGGPAQGIVSLDDMLAPSNRPGARGRMDALAPHPDSPACFLISGGTTGLPKLITRTHNDYEYNIRATSAVSGLSERTVYLGTLPASHNFPLACPGVLGTLFSGGTAVMLPSPEPTRGFETIQREGVTIASAVPAVAQRWMEHQREVGGNALESLEVLQVGGSRMPDELAAHVRVDLGATLQQVFGMAEGLINMTRLDDPDETIIATQGRPVSEADEIRIVNESGVDLPDGQPGLILTRGPYTPRGYFNAPDHNARAFVDGWYSSGDIVTRRSDGNLIVHGRDKDIVNRGGEKISAEEVENIVYRLDAVDLVAAVSMPDSSLGERLCLYAVLKPECQVTLDDIREFMVREGLAAFKLPERLELVNEMPLTKIGKIDKRYLREDVAAKLQALA